MALGCKVTVGGMESRSGLPGVTPHCTPLTSAEFNTWGPGANQHEV